MNTRLLEKAIAEIVESDIGLEKKRSELHLLRALWESQLEKSKVMYAPDPAHQLRVKTDEYGKKHIDKGAVIGIAKVRDPYMAVGVELCNQALARLEERPEAEGTSGMKLWPGAGERVLAFFSRLQGEGYIEPCRGKLKWMLNQNVLLALILKMNEEGVIDEASFAKRFALIEGIFLNKDGGTLSRDSLGKQEKNRLSSCATAKAWELFALFR